MDEDAGILAALATAQEELATDRLDLCGLIAVAVERAQELTGADRATVDLREGWMAEGRPAPVPPEGELGPRPPLTGALSTECLRTDAPVSCSDTDRDTRVDRRACRRDGIRSIVVVPLRRSGMTTGVLTVTSPVPRAFGPRSVRVLQLLGGLVADAVGRLAAAERHEHLLAEQIQAEERLRELILRDPLTGLPNRAVLRSHLEQALARGTREGTGVGVLFVDLDHFKLVNGTLGHEAGDELLRQVAERIGQVTRTCDLAGRFGGDEFVVICSNVNGIDELVAVTRRLEQTLAAPFQLAAGESAVTASVGVALADATSTAEGLLSQADMAMYRAKSTGRAGHELFSDILIEEATARVTMEASLRRALADAQLSLDYQSIVELRTGRIAGIEALLRWNHPERGPVAPLEFIPTAEESGLIVPVGRWVLQTAFAEVNGWRNPLLAPHPPLHLAVNVSARQLARSDFRDAVRAELEASGIKPGRVWLELTESIFVDASETALDNLRSLRDLGISIAVDDFGTGYSSVKYLRSLPIDAVKIDQTFVFGLPTDPGSVAIVHALAQLGRAFGLLVIAEGIETPEQAAMVAELGCTHGQGYLYGRPADLRQLERQLHSPRS